MRKPNLLLTPITLSILLAFSSCDDDSSSSCDDSNLSLALVSSSASACNEGGSLQLEASGGDGTYTYSIEEIGDNENGQFEDLVAGTYQVTVEDGTGCLASTSAEVEELTGSLTFETSVVSAADCVSGGGEISVTASNTAGEVSYSVDGGDFGSESTFANLAAGAHVVTVTDDNGCTEQEVVLSSGTTYSGKISSIISSNCAVSGCHVSGQSIPDFSDSENVRQRASTINSRVQSGSMPPSTRPDLTEEQKQLINCWVTEGALNN